MEPHNISLEYVPSAADLWRCGLRVAVCSCRVAFAVAALCLLLVSEGWDGLGLNRTAQLICSLAIPFAPIAILAVRVAMAWADALRIDMLGQKIEAGYDGITVLSPQCQDFVAWQDISSITVHNGDIFFWQSEGTGHFVARSAFPTPDSAEEFLHIVTSLRAQSRLAPVVATAR